MIAPNVILETCCITSYGSGWRNDVVKSAWSLAIILPPVPSDKTQNRHYYTDNINYILQDWKVIGILFWNKYISCNYGVFLDTVDILVCSYELFVSVLQVKTLKLSQHWVRG